MFENSRTTAELILHTLSGYSITEMTQLASALTVDEKQFIDDIFNRISKLPKIVEQRDVAAALVEIVSNYDRVLQLANLTREESAQLKLILETLLTHKTTQSERPYVRHNNQSPHRNPRRLAGQV